MKVLSYFLIFILLIGCKQADAVVTETDFSFDQEQPVNDRRISCFPKSIIGNYVNSDSTYLIVTDKQFIYKWIKKSNISFEDFEKAKDSARVVDNRIYLKDESFEFRKLKDSIEISTVDYDTIFSISENQTAKKIKSSIVLNTRDSIFWKIKMVRFDKKILTLKSLASFEDLNRIDSLSKTKVQKIDSTWNIIHLTKMEFKKMLKLNKFGYNQDFTKID